MEVMITSAQNQKVKDIRRLRRSKGERAVLEGPHLLREAIASGTALEMVLATPGLASSEEGAELLGRLPIPHHEVSPEVLAKVADADSPQGVMAVARLPRGGAEALPLVEGGLYLFVDGVQDPGNFGALARMAEAAGGAGMACSPGCAHPNHPRALRASAGSLLRVPLAWSVSPQEVARRLAPIEPRWVALVSHGGRSLYLEPLEGCLVLMVGSEGRGLSPALLRLAGQAVEIPLEPPVESLNVAAAAAVALFELRRRRVGSFSPLASPSLGESRR
jgi:RNA methyltransferase, TrmH family